MSLDEHQFIFQAPVVSQMVGNFHFTSLELIISLPLQSFHSLGGVCLCGFLYPSDIVSYITCDLENTKLATTTRYIHTSGSLVFSLCILFCFRTSRKSPYFFKISKSYHIKLDQAKILYFSGKQKDRRRGSQIESKPERDRGKKEECEDKRQRLLSKDR